MADEGPVGLSRGPQRVDGMATCESGALKEYSTQPETHSVYSSFSFSTAAACDAELEIEGLRFANATLTATAL
ncbi:hypothetical protein EYF80_067720 [Liparis tanakae]|uniref:Uncharacterized protein n=1 Tax=Liparis tanakae TaxID=230148 RepID=A0A4Z2E043_9TELE|nr:hypothetical protein EYF80_067720 [Liparis tanakae]